MSRISVSRSHEFDAGHRVTGHGGQCRRLHGHRYEVIFYATSETLDELGMVIDFAVLKQKLCKFLDDSWDHRFLIWEKDPQASALQELDPDGVVQVPFNPTAEALASYLLEVVGPSVLSGTGVRLYEVVVRETRKCRAAATEENPF